jgi:hypothetical protein
MNAAPRCALENEPVCWEKKNHLPPVVAGKVGGLEGQVGGKGYGLEGQRLVKKKQQPARGMGSRGRKERGGG